jgi:hypothetical protein
MGIGGFVPWSVRGCALQFPKLGDCLMTKKTTTTNDLRPSFVGKLEHVKTMQREGRANVFHRVVLLCEVFEDGDWLEKIRPTMTGGVIDETKAAAMLDHFVDDTGHTFLKLRAMLDRYPNEPDWVASNLSEMYEKLLAERRAVNDKQPTPSRWSCSKADYEAIEQELKVEKRKANRVEEAEDEVVRLRSQLAEAKKTIVALRAENDQLRSALSRPVVAMA